MTDTPVRSSKSKEPAVLRGQGIEQGEGRPSQAGQPHEQRTGDPVIHLAPFYHQPLGDVPRRVQSVYDHGLCAWRRTVHVVTQGSERSTSCVHPIVIRLAKAVSHFLFRGSRTRWPSSMPLKWLWHLTTSTHTTSSTATSSRKTSFSPMTVISRSLTLVSRSTVREPLGRYVAHLTISLRRLVFAPDRPFRRDSRLCAYL